MANSLRQSPITSPRTQGKLNAYNDFYIFAAGALPHVDSLTALSYAPERRTMLTTWVDGTCDPFSVQIVDNSDSMVFNFNMYETGYFRILSGWLS